jgi:hypothetical protein
MNSVFILYATYCLDGLSMNSVYGIFDKSPNLETLKKFVAGLSDDAYWGLIEDGQYQQHHPRVLYHIQPRFVHKVEG